MSINVTYHYVIAAKESNLYTEMKIRMYFRELFTTPTLVHSDLLQHLQGTGWTIKKKKKEEKNTRDQLRTISIENLACKPVCAEIVLFRKAT